MRTKEEQKIYEQMKNGSQPFLMHGVWCPNCNQEVWVGRMKDQDDPQIPGMALKRCNVCRHVLFFYVKE